ncbi:hypothetical protein BJX64DRAFT_282327 [Aspergillus heterothallicus]
MADEQFPWLEWPQNGYASSNLPHSGALAEESSNSHWRSPFYNSSTSSAVQTPQVNNNGSQSQYYPTYQQQEDSYVRLEDVVPCPSYRWGPPPTREYQRQSSYPESTSGLPAASLPQQSPIPNGTSRTAHSSASQPTTQLSQSTARRTMQHSRQIPQAPQRTASPATSQGSAPRATQYAQRTQPKATSQAPSSASPQAATQNLPSRQQQYSSPTTTTQNLSQSVQPNNATQARAQQAAQRLDNIKSRYSAPQNRPNSTTQQAPQRTFGPRPIAQSTSQFPSSQPVSRPAGQSATPPIPYHVQQTRPQEKQPSTQTAPPNPVAAQHTHPPPGPYGNLEAYSFQPDNPADRSHLKGRMDIVSRLKEGDAAQKITYDPKTIARDVLIAAGRHPNEPNLNHHLFRLRDVFSAVDVGSDLSTFRWDLVDPGQPPRDSMPRPPQGTTQARVGQTSQTAPQPAVQILNKSTPSQQPPIQQQQHPVSQPTSKQPLPQYRPQPKTQPQVQLQAPATQPAPTAAPKAQAKAAAPSPSTPKSDMEKRRRGRPPGSTNKPKVAVAPPAAPTAYYPVFACRWGNCQMELHNLDLLKKHLFKVHVSYSMVCGWKGCTHTGAMPAMELLKHVKETHLDALAWKLGDGPAVPTSVNRDSGAQTVPLTIPESNNPGNEDSLIFPASYSSIRAFNRVHGNNTQQEKAREIMKAVQRLKERIGVGLDPGGCELATPLRNKRVSNDEEVYEVRSE